MLRPLLLVLLCPMVLLADGPGDNVPDIVRPIPPKGSMIPAETEQQLRDGLKLLQTAIGVTETTIKGKKELEALLPDVLIYEKAVRWGLDYSELYVDEKSKRDDTKTALALLKKGMERAKELAEGKPSWTTAKGLVVRGYKSKIDGSVQPYGLVIPDDYDDKKPTRLDVWWHGRYENNLELSFIAERQRSRGEFSQPGVITVHPFGRFSNANKFAGEIDTFEVIDHVKRNYKIDDKRIVARGFSMGGAACWQFATHFPSYFAAAAPGAGFAETKEFLGNFQNEKVKPEWWEQKLWRMYDATEYAGNLFNIPTIAYSGENDRQKQAADIMTKYAKAAGVEFPHVIGKGAGHNYTNDAKKEVNKFIDEAAGKQREPKEIKFTTYTLRYNQCGPIRVIGLEKHWQPATIHLKDNGTVYDITTTGVTEFVLERAARSKFEIIVNGQSISKVEQNEVSKAESVPIRYMSGLKRWGIKGDETPGLNKLPRLQGPIDDAFMDSFLMVSPTGKPVNEKLGTWVDTEMKYATKHWRQQFRGDAPIKKDSEITEADIRDNNLILWGDAKSNAMLAKIKDKLPLMDTFGDTTIPALIYPNPLNPSKYVVLNSGFTYREYDYLNNARQVSKLPDYAVIDVTTPANSRFPGKIVRAGFFDERWKLQKNDGKDTAEPAKEPAKAPMGLWLGVLKVGPVHLRMGLKIEAGKGDEVKATLISIDQGRAEVPFDTTEFKDGKLTMLHKAAGINYVVSLDEKANKLTGEFKQGTMTFPLPMDSIKEVPTDKRPQTPKPPFDYDTEEVKFENTSAKIKLAGALTKPKGDGPFPVVVMISGSGPQDRDETLFNHKPFLVIADHLAKNGIACLRYDDRGVGKSGGKFVDATSADFATDAYAAVQYLKTRKEIDPKKIGLCGHSEGGLIAPMVAADHPNDIGFIVMLAGPGVPGSTIIFEQIRDFSEGNNLKKKEKDAREFVDAVMPILHSKGDRKEIEPKLKAKIQELIDKETDEKEKKTAMEALPAMVERMSDPWLRWFVTFDPATSLSKVKCPILALNGDKDVQVKTQQNFEAIESILAKAGHKQHKLVSYKNLNHLFQNCKTGDLSEYGQIEETMAKEVLDELTTWIKKQK